MAVRTALFRIFQKNSIFYLTCLFGLTTLLWMAISIHKQDQQFNPIHYESNLVHDKRLNDDPPNNFDVAESPEFTTSSQQMMSKLSVENRILIFVYRSKSLVQVCHYLRLKYTQILYLKSSAPNANIRLSNGNVGLFSVIVFDDIRSYIRMDTNQQDALSRYCKHYGVGIVFFSGQSSSRVLFPVPHLPISIESGLSIDSLYIDECTLFKITRSDTRHSVKQYEHWTSFSAKHSSYKTLATGRDDVTNASYPLVVLDPGQYDGIRRIFIGHVHGVWINKIIYLDVLNYMTSGAIKVPTTKYIQIDIDDIFLGGEGAKITAFDVKAMLDTQEKWRSTLVPGFSFYLGFCGSFFKRGNEQDQAGDQALIDAGSKFNWFDHTYKHLQAHKFNLTYIVEQMEKNKQFAQRYNIPVHPDYSVSPHHSGVFPVHEELYTAWKQVWNISVTSTEEYPHLRPQDARKGFIHRDIQVLPRQTCGLFTKNLYYKLYPEGPEKLEYNIHAGDLFDTVLYNQVNIYMTHQQNYAADRLSLYTFTKLFEHFNQSTTFSLTGAPPTQLSQTYFNTHREEKTPIWINPCTDPRHMEIWNEKKKCDNLPGLLIVGPQKTGTTALYKFLNAHPNITSNENSPVSFEELQFFGTKNYLKGLDWYLEFFTSNPGLVFEKSATYFDSAQTPRQAYGLLPNAKIIIILINPIDRAFSWYNHQKAHGLPAAMSNSFYDIITSNQSNHSIQSLRGRMLKPGFYMEHVVKWRQYYSNEQVMYIDAEELKIDPVSVLKQVQIFLNVPKLDYSNVLKHEDEKGFFCIVKPGSTEPDCLGSSKGRSKTYGQVDEKSRKYLQEVYKTPNEYLRNYLIRYNKPLPGWLQTPTDK